MIEEMQEDDLKRKVRRCGQFLLFCLFVCSALVQSSQEFSPYPVRASYCLIGPEVSDDGHALK